MLNTRRLYRVRKWLVLVAALPMLQFSQCQTGINQTLAQVANGLPSLLFSSLFSALLQTLLGLLGTDLASTFGGTGLGGGGFSGT